VVGEDDRPVGGEDGVELALGQPVRVLGLLLQAHQVDDVDDPHFQVGQALAQQCRGGERLQRRDVAAARKHDVGLGAGVVRGPLPDPDPARAVDDRVVHREVVQRRLLARDDHVHVVAAAQAVVADRQQAVRVRRQVDADHVGLLVDDVVDEAWVLVREAVVVLAPDVRREQVVEGPDRAAPRDLPRHLQPLRVLVEHRVDDVDEGLVAVEKAVPAGEQVALEPALAEVFAQHLDRLSLRGEVLVRRQDLGLPLARGRGEDVGEAIRGGLVRPEHAEVVGVALDHVAQEPAEHARRLAEGRARLVDLDRVVAEVGQQQVSQQRAAVCVRARAHPPVALRRQLEQLRQRGAVVGEQLLGSVGAHPLLEQAQVISVLARVDDRHLVRPPAVLDRLAVDLLRARPALRRAQHDHRPLAARAALHRGDPVQRLVEPRREALVHAQRVLAVEAAGDEDRLVAAALHQRNQLALRDPGEHRRVRDLVAVQMQDRENGAVRLGVQELVRVPARGERAGLGLAVADDAADRQPGVVERRAVGVRERVAELAALVDRARRLGRGVARDAAGERELAEERLQARLVERDVRIELGVGAFEVRACDNARAAVPGAADGDRVEVAGADGAIHVRIDQVQPGHRPEVAEQPRLDVLGAQRLA